jgi:hypothetical protein
MCVLPWSPIPEAVAAVVFELTLLRRLLSGDAALLFYGCSWKLPALQVEEEGEMYEGEEGSPEFDVDVGVTFEASILKGDKRLV